MTTTLISAPLWRRFAALLYDSFLLVAISLAYGGITTAISAKFNPVQEQDFQPMFTTGSAGELLFLGWILTLAAFYIISWWRRGQTVGMKAWRIEVIDDSTKQHPAFVKCSQRAAWGFFSLFFLGAGYWYRFFNTDGQCMHDKLTGTHVIVRPKKS